MRGLPDLRNCSRSERISCILAQPRLAPSGSKTTALMRGSVAAWWSMAQTLSTVTGVFCWKKGMEISSGGRSGTSPSRRRKRVEPSATEGGRERKEATAKTPITTMRMTRTTPVTSPIRNLPIGYALQSDVNTVAADEVGTETRVVCGRNIPGNGRGLVGPIGVLNEGSVLSAVDA